MSDGLVKRQLKEREDFIARIETLEAERDRLRRLVDRAYREGYTDGYHTSNPHKDIAGDWMKSEARATLIGGKE